LSSDYNGVDTNATDGIVRWTSMPSSNSRGTWLSANNLFLGASDAAYTRVGLNYTGSTLTMYTSGSATQATANLSFTAGGAGLASVGNDANPDASYRYLWIGSEPINFDPELISSTCTGTVGAEAPF